VHSVTRESLFLVLAALEAAGRGPDDRVEHAADVPPEAIELLAARGVTVVTQPSLIWRRGADYLARVDQRDRADLWRHRSLLDAGIPVAMSSDAPYGDPDPWRSIRAAVERETATGEVLGADESVTPDAALDGFLTSSDAPGGAVRKVAVGADADLIVLDCSRAELLADPDSSHVRATLIGGVPAYLRTDDGR
jgi:predicted amidohydrolase YtcJ